MECYNFKCKNKNCEYDKYKMAACIRRQTEKQAAFVKLIHNKFQCESCYSKMITGRLKYSKQIIILCTECGAIKTKESAA